MLRQQPLQQEGGALNLRKLQKELACALEEDSAHRREDAAKKRAIRTAQSYDEFRHRVACAHLTPLSRQDIDSLGRPKRGWGTPAQRPTASTPSFSSTPVAAAAPTTQAATYNTAAAFEKEWRRRRRQQHDGRYEACVALLRAAGGAGFIRARLSKGELGPDLLGEMVEALGAAVAPSTSTTDGEADVPWARACVVALGATPRFGLHCALLSAGQREAGRALVEAVAAGLRPAADSEETGEARALARVREALV